LVRLDNPAIEVPDEDPHEVGVDQPPHPGFQPAPAASEPRGLVHLPDSVIKPRPRGLRGSAKVAVAGLERIASGKVYHSRGGMAIRSPGLAFEDRDTTESSLRTILRLWSISIGPPVDVDDIGTSTSHESNSSRTIAARPTNASPSASLEGWVPAAQLSDRRDKAIAAPEYRGDISVAGLAIRQGTSQRANTDLEIAFIDESLGPDLRNQLRLGHDLARAFHKSHQEVEGATGDTDGLVIFQQKSSCPEQPERTKGYFGLGRVTRPTIRRHRRSPFDWDTRAG
jgi:hypothetical protein